MYAKNVAMQKKPPQKPNIILMLIIYAYLMEMFFLYGFDYTCFISSSSIVLGPCSPVFQKI